MSNYERIEREIAFFGVGVGEHHHITVDDARDVSESLRLLLDVARAVEPVINQRYMHAGGIVEDANWHRLQQVLTALKERVQEGK